MLYPKRLATYAIELKRKQTAGLLFMGHAWKSFLVSFLKPTGVSKRKHAKLANQSIFVYAGKGIQRKSRRYKRS